MARRQFEMTGGPELERALLNLSTAIAKRIGMQALRKAGKPILDAYKAGTTVASGALVENEAMGPRSRLNKRQKRMTPKPSPREIEINIGTADPAGLQEELGLRQDANPALTRAWDAQGGQTAVNTIARELGAGIERQARRDGRR
ncbi:hypothetical protein [Novosphingobium album (ex Liu et al. 2023)]|uniref:HK97 gp10 family phage protein n=1 Tax=Novosphingobium album (ex Liu et al. 2023) TaxID=3031130 RepID=A0ABT5WPT1_9SPHN|nr:hypothetical protein [Novosphingobium album (ex Liu et al. 2023)]MDE8651884.1 hypothetical protein [Novosphingobium album (ex Liu et al. 2023)]